MVRPNYSKDALASPRAQRLRKELEGVLRTEKPRWKTSYKGPDPDRQKIDGKMVVSREELADFRKRFGANKTLRDLLNADRTGKLPSPVNAGRGAAEGRKAEDRDTAPLRASSGPAAPYRDKAAEAKREADTSALLERMKERAKPRMSASDIPGLVMRGMAEGAERVPPGRGLGAMFVGGVGSGAKAARGVSAARDAMAQRATGAGGSVRPDLRKEFEAFRRGDDAAMQQARMAREAAEEAARARARSASSGRAPEPRREPAGDFEKQGRVFRSARPEAEAAKQAEYMRRVEELGLKKGGSTKSYAKGGMTKGGGCETRGKKTRYI
jgi:hypothetical protein